MLNAWYECLMNLKSLARYISFSTYDHLITGEFKIILYTFINIYFDYVLPYDVVQGREQEA